MTARQRARIVAAVLASWLLAVASLATALYLLPVTHADAPDHLE